MGPSVGTYSQDVRKSGEEGEREWERPLRGISIYQEKGRGRTWPAVNAFRCWGHRRSSCLYVQRCPVGQKLTRFHFSGLSSYCDDGIVH